MKQVSEELYAFLQSKTEFTDVIGDRLFALAAPGDTQRPFACFRIVDLNGETKDADACMVSLSVFFGPEQYSECTGFCDVMKPIIKKKYDWISSEPDFDEEDLSYLGIINFKINN